MPTKTDEDRRGAPGVLLVLNDVVKDMEDEFNRWYQEQHLGDRLGIDGFQRARRYRSVDGQPNYMAVFDCRSIDVLGSSAYRGRLASPTDWTKKVMPGFRNMQRSACRETWSTGDGTGGSAIVVQCKPVQGREADARRFIEEKFGPNLMLSNCTVRLSLWEADAAVTAVPSHEALLRGVQDSVADWVLFVECYDLGQMALALHTQILTGEGARTGLLIGSWMRYQLICERLAQRAAA